MKLEEVLIEFEGFDGARLGVGGFDLPGNEFGFGIKDRIFGAQLEGILRLGTGLFAAAVELQGIENEEVIHGGPIGVGLGAFLQELIVIGNGGFLEHGLVGEGGGELFVDLSENTREVPSLEIIGGCGTGA